MHQRPGGERRGPGGLLQVLPAGGCLGAGLCRRGAGQLEGGLGVLAGGRSRVGKPEPLQPSGSRPVSSASGRPGARRGRAVGLGAVTSQGLQAEPPRRPGGASHGPLLHPLARGASLLSKAPPAGGLQHLPASWVQLRAVLLHPWVSCAQWGSSEGPQRPRQLWVWCGGPWQGRSLERPHRSAGPTPLGGRAAPVWVPVLWQEPWPSPGGGTGMPGHTVRPLEALAGPPGAAPGGQSCQRAPAGCWELRFNYVERPGCWDSQAGINVNSVLLRLLC